jgi:hypothetical protein
MMRVCKSTRRLPVTLRTPKTRRPSAPYERDEEYEEAIGTQEELAESPAEGGEDDSDEEELDGGALRAYEDAREEPETQEPHDFDSGSADGAI